MRERKLLLLQVFGGGFFLARATESGQLAPVGPKKGEGRSLKLEADKFGHLRNVAAWIAFRLQEQNSSRFGGIDTSDASTIAEGKPSDSLRIILGRTRNEERLKVLARVLVREFGCPGICGEEREGLLQGVFSALKDLADITYKK